MPADQLVTVSPPDSPRRKGRILVTDDEDGIRYIFRTQLERDGYDVACARDGAEALDLLHAGEFDLLLTDLEMPQMNGYTLIRCVQRLWPELPILICSGSALQVGVPEDVQAIVAGILPKPITVQKLSEAVGLSIRPV